jgi:hypothetical protein
MRRGECLRRARVSRAGWRPVEKVDDDVREAEIQLQFSIKVCLVTSAAASESFFFNEMADSRNTFRLASVNE